MKQPKPYRVSRRSGFTLVEVLIALAIAALGFGVVLHSVGLQMSLVAGAVDRHQMLMHASEALERTLSSGKFVNSGSELAYDNPDTDQNSEQEGEEELEAAQYFYTLNASPVTADPRIQKVSVKVRGGRGQVHLSAYRIRVKRDDG